MSVDAVVYYRVTIDVIILTHLTPIFWLCTLGRNTDNHHHHYHDHQVSNPTMATNNVEDYRHSTHLLAATTLRNVLGTKCLAQVFVVFFLHDYCCHFI